METTVLALSFRFLKSSVVAVLGASLIAIGAAVPVEAASTTYSAPLRTAVKSLPVAAESNSWYNRDKYFGVWIDSNKDCQNTRQEVLLQETRMGATYTSSKRCTVKSGKWVTTWDNKIHTSASTVQIDHLVPVHEAWGSGAKKWTQAKRVAFYNDISDKRTLNAQTGTLNAAKGARGPEHWLPPKNRCQYVTDWVAVKKRWGLSVDPVEKAALTRLANGCPNVTVTVVRR